MTSRFLQIHYLSSYPAALLNRDDAGFAKRIVFGGRPRTRISSQCAKRHWRSFQGSMSLSSIQDGEADAPLSVRSRRSFERYVYDPLVNVHGVSAPVAEALTATLMEAYLGKSKSPKADSATDAVESAGAGSTLRSNQVTVFGRPEMDFFLSTARNLSAGITDVKAARKVVEEFFKRDARSNLDSLRLAAGLDAAMFGRMVTSDQLARYDAAVHVQHAFTVHEEASEADYFSAVDDLVARDVGELGSGHIGSTELTSGLYYGYVVVDVPLLVSNIEGGQREDWKSMDRALAGEAVRRLVHLISKVSPGAKLGSTAPYSYAHCVLVECGDAQPRSLANAFLKPVTSNPDMMVNTYRALGQHVADLDAMYGSEVDRRMAVMGPLDALSPGLSGAVRLSVPALADWTAERVAEAQ